MMALDFNDAPLQVWPDDDERVPAFREIQNAAPSGSGARPDGGRLCPNRANINRHLYSLFPASFSKDYPDAWIEIAYAWPATGNDITQAVHFSPFDLAKAADFAEQQNRAGYNIYIGPALRKGATGPNGRSSDANYLDTAYAWADFEAEGDYTRVSKILKEKKLLTAMLVMTGTVPHERAHLYFKINGSVTAAQIKSANTALKTLLSTDDVQNPGRLLRLAGCVSYPSPIKTAKGYVPELVTLHIRKKTEAYAADHIIGLAGGPSRTDWSKGPFDFNKAKRQGHTEDELIEKLEASRGPDKWHNNIRDAIASMVGRGWSDNAIRMVCRPYCRDGYGDPDLDDLIDGARRKWNKPEDPKPDDPKPRPPPSPGIPLDYYENFGNAIAKSWIFKVVLAIGETSSFVGPPGSGKSALLADAAMHAAMGTDWRGYRAKQRVGVVYFALERGQLTKRRMLAMAGPPKLPIAVAGQVIDLIRPSCVQIIVDTIRTAEAHFGLPVGLIIIDTFNKGIAVGGGDENKAMDQNIVAANLRRVHELVAVHIALVGHTGKDETRGARGSNAHLGDVDLMVQIAVEGEIRTATITMINDGAESVLTRFKLKTVVLGQDEGGDDITTAIVSDDLLGGGKTTKRAKLSMTQQMAMEMLERIIIDAGKPAPTTGEYPKGVRVVTVKQWRDACRKGGLSPAGTDDSANKAFWRATKELKAMHRIGVWDDLVWIAYD